MSTVQEIAGSAADEVSAMLGGREVLVLVVDDEVMRVGVSGINDAKRVREIFENALKLLEQG